MPVEYPIRKNARVEIMTTSRPLFLFLNRVLRPSKEDIREDEFEREGDIYWISGIRYDSLEPLLKVQPDPYAIYLQGSGLKGPIYFREKLDFSRN